MKIKLNYVGKCLLISNGKERVLVIGDLHLGYEGALRQGGLQIPLNLYNKIKKDFDEIYEFVLNEFGRLSKIIILGDVKHEFGSILQEEWNEIGRFVEHLKERCDELVIVEGNHDKILFLILRKLKVAGVDYYLWNEFAFLHGNKDFEEIYNKKIKCWIMGHGHPAVALKEEIKTEKFKCFLEGTFKGKKIIILPSFFPLTEGTDPRDFDLVFAWDFNLNKFNVRVVGENLEVLNFGALSGLKS